MYGVELGATLPFGDFIPALDGFGATGGVGWTQSKVHIYPGAPATMLPGYSKWVANGTLYFEKWGFNARGSVRYRSSFQGEVSGFAQNNRIPPSQAGDHRRRPGRIRLPAGLGAQRIVALRAGAQSHQRAVRDDEPGRGPAGHRLSALRSPLDAGGDVQVRRLSAAPASAAAASSSAPASACAAGDADVRGRKRDPGDGCVSGASASPPPPPPPAPERGN